MGIDPTRKYLVLDPKESYSFDNFFEFPYEAEDILADLDCSLERTELNLPMTAVPSEQLNFLRNYIQENLRLTTPIAEISRREFLITPVIRQICLLTNTSTTGRETS